MEQCFSLINGSWVKVRVNPVNFPKSKERNILIILGNVLGKIKPSDEEQSKLLDVANEMCSKLQNALGNRAKVMLGGSLAKGTNLR